MNLMGLSPEARDFGFEFGQFVTVVSGAEFVANPKDRFLVDFLLMKKDFYDQAIKAADNLAANVNHDNLRKALVCIYLDLREGRKTQDYAKRRKNFKTFRVLSKNFYASIRQERITQRFMTTPRRSLPEPRLDDKLAWC